MTTKSHGMFFVGKLFIQAVPTLPIWTVDDVARVIFVEDEEIVYVGGTIAFGNWIAIGTKWKDEGEGTDPISGNLFLGRLYKAKMENGNLIMEYTE